MSQLPPVGESSGFRRLRVVVLSAVPIFAVWVAVDLGGSRVTIVVDELGQLLAAAGAGLACWLRSRHEGGATRRGWALLGASCLAWAAGQVVWAWYDALLGVETPFPSFADVGFLAAVPLAAAGMASFPGAGGGSRPSLRTVLDGVLVAASVLFVSWVLVLGPLYRSGVDSVFARALSLAYPIGDVVTITAVVILLARLPLGGTRRSLALVGTGLLAVAVADTAFAWFTEVGTFEPGNLFDIGWFAGFSLVALGALHSSEAEGGATPASAVDRAVYVPYVPGVVALAVAMVQSARGELDSTLQLFGYGLVALLGARLLAGLRENVSLSRNLEALAAAREARFAALVRRSSDLVSIVTPEGVVLYQSPSVQRTLGHTVEDVVGTDVVDLVHPDDRALWAVAVWRATKSRSAPVVIEWRMLHADGTWHVLETTVTDLLDEPAVGGLVLNARDVTERKALEDQLLHNAFHDPLTGLANRALFRNRLEHALAVSTRVRKTVAVLFVDLDEFKAVNDGQGHDAGDELLVEMAGRLRAAVREADTVARFGGDEFALLIEHADGEAEAVRVAERVKEALTAPFVTHVGPVAVTASVGIATAMGSESAEDLLRNADVAMYVAKDAGGRHHETFRPEMHAAVLERIQLETDLRAALEREEFVVHYQPIADLSDGSLVGVEALLRWMHPTRGLVPPLEFVPVAEATGLIVPIGEWLLRRACTEAAGWCSDGRPVSLSVNLSARQVRENDLVEVVRGALESTSLEPERLTLEITESVLLDTGDEVVNRLQQLRAMGVRLSIDDFGTGYSSLGYLKHLPVDELKVDRSFVAGLGSNTEDANVVETIVALARNYGLDTVAEGIETPRQLAELQSMGCSRAQGFYLAKPMPGADIAMRLKRSAGALDHPVPAAHALTNS